jgi:hypothetical protein
MLTEAQKELPTPAIDVDGFTKAFTAAQMHAYAAQQVAAETARCAKVAEGAHQLPNDGKEFANGWCSAALQIEQAIRMGKAPTAASPNPLT